jgi:hypothetical protein
MKLFSSVVSLGLIGALATSAHAQRGAGAQKDSAKKSAIPADARPPKGMCRVWLNGVPAAQQPAATDCATAVKNLPPNARIIFGDEFADSAKTNTNGKPKLPPNIKGFSGTKPPPTILPKPPE